MGISTTKIYSLTAGPNFITTITVAMLTPTWNFTDGTLNAVRYVETDSMWVGKTSDDLAGQRGGGEGHKEATIREVVMVAQLSCPYTPGSRSCLPSLHVHFLH